MFTIKARNVNEALALGMRVIKANGKERDSRNGPVLVMPTPVTTVYDYPNERVLFSPERDANPFFHLVESLWMLAGRNDLATLTPYVANMKNFSDDGGKTQPGAYGYRWREHFWYNKIISETAQGTTTDSIPIDQLLWAIDRLKKDPDDRRVVIQMYDATIDQPASDAGGKDIPCNIVAAPWIDVFGNLSMSIFCRSNDMILGAYGANAVHFSFMMEYLAVGIGRRLGTMFQISNNFHAYTKDLDRLDQRLYEPRLDDPYVDGKISPMRLFLDGESLKEFDEDLTLFFDNPSMPGLRTSFLRKVAAPIVLAHKAYRDKSDPLRFETALEIIEQCKASDWRRAGREWLLRRQQEFRLKTKEKE